MIVKLANWSSHPEVKKICEKLLTIEGTSRKSTPQRCVIKRNKDTLASIGLDKSAVMVEFLPEMRLYAEAHGTSFVKPHPLPQMAREGWLIARPEQESETDQVTNWILASIL